MKREVVEGNAALLRQITDHQTKLHGAVTSPLERILATELPTYLCKIRGRPTARYAATRAFFWKEEFDMLQISLCIPTDADLKCCQHSSSSYIILTSQFPK